MLAPSRRASGQCVFCALGVAPFSTYPTPHANRTKRDSRKRPSHFSAQPLAHQSRALSLLSRKTTDLNLETKVFRFTPDSASPGGRQYLKEVYVPEKQKKGARLRLRLAELEAGLENDPLYDSLGLDLTALRTQFGRFKKSVESQQDAKSKQLRRLHHQLHAIADRGMMRELGLTLKYGFYAFVASARLNNTVKQDQKKLLNFRFPAAWYPKAREIQRDVHVHVGPTNSGKTYHALKRLQDADTGLYAGPLRLLAHEVYERLNALGKVCALITGDDRRQPHDDDVPKMVSCTVEMVSTTLPVDVAVIDEIQLLGSEDRGWAWTEALLGVRAKEVHVCGEARAVPLLEELVAACGDKLHIHRYERLSPLEMMPKPLSGLAKLRKGDCVVAFSVMTLHSLRNTIERQTKKKCAIIYGSLPPEVRAQQARLFNDPDNDYDFLVASNAIGMGINLRIKRLVFRSGGKTIAGKFTPLDVAEVKQIAGRAGRYSAAVDDNKRSVGSAGEGKEEPPAHTTPSGLVTTMDSDDHAIVEQAMGLEPDPLASAGILPPAHVVEQFARYFPTGTPFAYLLMQMKELCRHHKRLHMCVMTSQLGIADAIEPVKGLRIYDRLTFCMSPVETRRPQMAKLIRVYAQMVAESHGKSVEEIDELELELLDGDVQASREFLEKLENLHRSLILFLWLSYKFVGIFKDREVALHAKELVEIRIDESLSKMAVDSAKKQTIGQETFASNPEDKTNELSPGYAGFGREASTLAATTHIPHGHAGTEGASTTALSPAP